jgi:hypothetical protein
VIETVQPYLIQFGRTAFVGRFENRTDVLLERNQSVVIKTARGLELGTVLCPVAERFVRSLEDVGGEIIRPSTAEDLTASNRTADFAANVLARAEQLAANEPISLIDAEATLDSACVALHLIPFAECDLQPILQRLSEEFQTTVTLHDITRGGSLPDAPDAVEAGCGKPNCGSESGGGGCGTGGGCSTGSCSRGKVKSAEELTAYFADLRGKMEADSAKRVALA